MGNRSTIFRQNDKLFIENMYTDGSSVKKEMVEKSSGIDQLQSSRYRDGM